MARLAAQALSRPAGLEVGRRAADLALASTKVRLVSPDLSERVIPTSFGFSDEVKRKAARAERAWEAATGLFGATSATATATIAAGIAIPPLAPFLGLVAASSFFFKLRAKWAKEDPPRSDFSVTTDYRPPRLDLMPVMPPGSIPAGAGVPTLLLAAAASVEATVVCVERATGAAIAREETKKESAQAALADRVREAYTHARRTEMLTMSIGHELPGLYDQLPYTAFEQARQVWHPQYASRSLADVLGERTLGRLIATGVDERLLNFPLPRDFPLPIEAVPGPPGAPVPGAAPADQADQKDVVREAAAAAEEFGGSLRQWAWEATLEIERL